MLFRVDPTNPTATRRFGVSLRKFGMDERAFQDVLFNSIDELLPDDLLVVMQSRRGAEQPDLMAVDQEGRLFIFELKAGEADTSNFLQVLRYGQIYGPQDYDRLNVEYQRWRKDGRTLQEAHHGRFGTDLPTERFNHAQVFVTLTNGINDRARAAAAYWRAQGLDVQPWVYLIYEAQGGAFDVELRPFPLASDSDPYQDIPASFYLLNTNRSNDAADDLDMVENGKAAAYFYPWKHKIEKLNKGDHVFLYRSGEGIVGHGTASGELQKRDYHQDHDAPDEEYAMNLLDYQRLASPVTAARIKDSAERSINFRQTMVALPIAAGEAVLRVCRDQS